MSSSSKKIQARPYRVMAVTNESLKDIKPPVDLTSYSYCTPQTRFWLCHQGLEDPEATFVLLEFQYPTPNAMENPRNTRFPDWIVEFEYDGGRYVGTHNTNFAKAQAIANLLHIPTISSFLYDISSL